jgi:hypothetical protein
MPFQCGMVNGECLIPLPLGPAELEAGTVAVYTDSEADIRVVTDIANDLLRLAAE